MRKKYQIDANINKAETLPASFYRSHDVLKSLRNRIFLKSWQWLGHEWLVPIHESVHPLILLDQFLSEPIVITRDKEGQLSCLSNVCTHRANLVALEPSKKRSLICSYHGRRFSLDGKFVSMPEFSDAVNFPRPCDNLHRFNLKKWGPFLFVGLDDHINIDQIIRHMDERIGFMPLEQFVPDPSLTKTYTIDGHWALYCDNYLEGFHIPFVHDGLNEVLNYDQYKTELFPHCILQIGYARQNDMAFDLPVDHMDSNDDVAAYYFFVFPNMMFNFYPWGLSVNIVEPITIDKTKVTFKSYVFDRSKLNQGAGSGLNQVELEDEQVIHQVAKGLKSSVYSTGRFSPTKEKGVYHFHRLLASYT